MTELSDLVDPRKEKLKEYSSTVSIETLLLDPNSIFLPQINARTWEGTDINILGVISPHYPTDSIHNKSIRLYATSDSGNLIGYTSTHLFHAFTYSYTARGALATYTQQRGIGTMLVASMDLLLKNISEFSDVMPKSIIYYRSFDENGYELNKLESKNSSDPSCDRLLQLKQKERESWLRLYGNQGLAGYKRCLDDEGYIEKYYRVSPTQSLSNTTTIYIERNDRNSLYSGFNIKNSAEHEVHFINKQNFSRLISNNVG